MFSMRRTKARQRACQVKDEAASRSWKMRAVDGSSPQMRSA
jgi:hypothetical protein